MMFVIKKNNFVFEDIEREFCNGGGNRDDEKNITYMFDTSNDIDGVF